MKAKKKSLFIIFLAIGLTFILIYLFIWAAPIILNTSSESEFWHEKSKNVFANIERDLSKEKIIEIARSNNWPEKLMRVKDSEILLYTPFEYPAKNWVLIFLFSDDKLVYAKVRTEDNIKSKNRPDDAPEDIGAFEDIKKFE